MVVLEAAACGRPVVGTHVGILPELAPMAGRTARVGDADGLAEALADVCSDDGLARELGCGARGLAETDFSLARCVDRFRACYAHLVEAGVTPGRDL